MSRYYALIGDYIIIITVKLDSATTRSVEELFESIRSLEEANYQRVARVLNGQSKLSLKVEHNPTKAAAFTRKFKEFFGV